MKYFLIVLFIIACTSQVQAQEQETTITDTVSKNYLLGKFTWLEWQQKANWPSYEAPDYKVPFNFIESLRQKLDGRKISFIVFSASWCSDSKKGMPQLYKLFALLPIEESRIELYGVDKAKLDPDNMSLLYDLDKVPTLIVLEDGKEIGRIVEIPLLSWYEDLLDILK